MKKWIVKAFVQKTISFLPASHKINFIFQKYVTRGVRLTDDYFEDKLIHAQKHLHFYKEIKGKDNFPHSCLELGTGWYPVVPICFWLIGAEKVYTVDISPLLNKNAFLQTLIKFLEWSKNGSLEKFIHPEDERLKFIEDAIIKLNGKGLPELLSAFNLSYIVDDASEIKINNIDYITSNNVLEHIYPEFLIPILNNLYFNVLKEGGMMSHFIDMSDHFAHADKSISIYNFLKFSDAQWKWIDNNIQPQNRLRLKEYEDIFKSLKIPIKVKEYREGNTEILKSIKINERFLKYPLEDLAISHAYVFSNK
jgi:predicted SAM-dependent methyltransferase